MLAWYRHIEQTATNHPWVFAAISAVVLSGLAASLSVAMHHPARETLVQVVLWGPGWFLLSGLVAKVRRHVGLLPPAERGR